MTRQSDLDCHLEKMADPDIDGTNACPKCGGEMMDKRRIDRAKGKVYDWRACACGYEEE